MDDRVERELLRVIGKHCAPGKRETLTLDTPIEETGIDSLSMSEIMFELEDIFDMSIPNPSSDDDEPLTLRAIRDAIAKAIPVPDASSVA